MELFVYGTLTDPDRVAEVLGEDFSLGRDATLSGLHRVDGEYPTLAPGGDVEGRILHTPKAEALDAYEGVDRGLYVRVSVPLVGRDREGDSVEVYVGDPDRLGTDVEWAGSGPFAERVREYVREHDVAVRRS